MLDQNKILEPLPVVKKTVTWYFGASMVFGIMMGSGIFITANSPFAMFKNQPIMLVVLVWFVGGILSLIGALCYAELASRIPESGGEIVYFRMYFSKALSRTFAIFFFFGIRPLSLASLSLTFGEYIVSAFDSKDHYYLQRIFAMAALFFWLIVNLISKKLVNILGLTLSNFKLVAVFIIVGCGIHSFATKNLPEWKSPFKTSGIELTQVPIAVKDIAWSNEGWNIIGGNAGEMKNPIRDIPISLSIGVIMVNICYILCVISYSAILGYDTAKTTTTMGTSIATQYLGRFSPILPVLIALSAFASVNYDIFTNGIFGMSAGFAGEFPKIFSLIHTKTRIPVVSLTVTILTVISLLFFSLKSLIGYVAFLSWICYFFAFVVLWIIKIKSRRQVKTQKIFTIPYPFIVLMQVVCLIVVVLCYSDEIIGCSVVTVTAIIFIGLHYVPIPWKRFDIFSPVLDSFGNFLCSRLNFEYAVREDLTMS